VGYDLHIRRAEQARGSEKAPITLAEWAQYVAGAHDFRMDDHAEAALGDGQTLRIERDGIAVWTGHPESDTVWFRYHAGAVVVSNPDEAVRRRMFEVAAALGARVQGDEGELYDAEGRAIPDENWDEHGRPRHGTERRRSLLSRLVRPR
jgi:hypothetical protein